MLREFLFRSQISADLEASTEAHQERGLRQVVIEIKRTSWIKDFKFLEGSKFCFGSHAYQANEDGDLVSIQLDEPKPKPDVPIC